MCTLEWTVLCVCGIGSRVLPRCTRPGRVPRCSCSAASAAARPPRTRLRRLSSRYSTTRALLEDADLAQDALGPPYLRTILADAGFARRRHPLQRRSAPAGT